MDLFDIVGPVMIGPSSSHTAGAARIGLTARTLLGEQPVRAEVGFHGSFAKTGRGHGTDRAVVGGLLGMAVDDPRLRNAIALAREAGMELDFSIIHLRGAHPNSVQLKLWRKSGETLTMQAASTGGGNIEVTRLGGLPLAFSGRENTLIIHHPDTPGMIAQVAGLLAGHGMNIATMQVFRRDAGAEAVMVLELDTTPSGDILAELRSRKEIRDVSFLPKRRA